MSFAYDANRRIVKASKNGVADAWTVYDGGGNRVAEKINGVWQFVIYDAFGKLVAEYGMAGEGRGGVSWVLQDWQGSVRASVNSNGFISARFDFTAFGEKISLGVGLRTIDQGYSAPSNARQGYGLTETDSATGLDHTWFRKIENRAGRFTSPDPNSGSMSRGNPQSFNRYRYAGNDPINFVDPSGLYEACVHQAMTKFLGDLAKYPLTDAIAGFTGDGLDGADSDKWAATGLSNAVQNWTVGGGPSQRIHFPTAAELASSYSDFQKVRHGRTYDERRWAGFIIHSIQDGYGAHVGRYLPAGHLSDNANGKSPDRVLGDSKFITAATKTYQALKADPNAELTPKQIKDLIDAIIAFCDNKFQFVITWPHLGGGGGHGVGIGGGGGGGGGGRWGNARQFDWLELYYRSLFPRRCEECYYA